MGSLLYKFLHKDATGLIRVRGNAGSRPTPVALRQCAVKSETPIKLGEHLRESSWANQVFAYEFWRSR